MVPAEPGRHERAMTQTERSAAPLGTADDELTVTELTDRWRRALADLDNLRKRYVRDLDRERAAERTRVAGAWLPVLDDVELALVHAEADPDTIRTGLRVVRDKAVEVLARLGFPRQDQEGVPFDPARHEVVRIIDDPNTAPNTVVEVFRPGYGEGERLLRPTAVTVNAPGQRG